MTSPRSTYSGGYYASPSFPDTPIYDSLVAERGTPQIAPIRVNPSPWDTGSSLPALPSALPALPSGSTPPPASHGYPGAAAQPVAPLQHTPAPYIPQQAGTGRGYQPPQQYQRPAPGGSGTGYEAMRPAAPVAPRPASPFDDPGYGRQYPPRGY
ncbi:hypothetical protein ADL22_05500 [Streptomyces sp. NRRL F-4489]|uniref:DUF6643 family protein n=1 Tax=Streptomyces sp. NRRL F-4489 TaxID=1609095 RepID=UPI0007462A5E|nr:DUF6643 family protein [Streptomyces sp. NRRL F-4489]KUL52254.1 hypothetical protein ADL22_05500 [Streptomyces sp. NRRL F-4489]